MAIVIGHGAYTGANAMKVAKNKADAIRILRSRGVRRDDARKVITAVANCDYAWQVIRVYVPEHENCGSVIEVTNRPDVSY